MTCSTGSTILAWSHAPALVRREPIQLSPGHPLVVELKGAVKDMGVHIHNKYYFCKNKKNLS
jgi:hypothetical protein